MYMRIPHGVPLSCSRLIAKSKLVVLADAGQDSIASFTSTLQHLPNRFGARDHNKFTCENK
jgi:hypothetical protein